jgi:hypothetical protein
MAAGHKVHLKTKRGLACGARTDFMYSGGLAHYASRNEGEVTCLKCKRELARYKKNNYNWR